MSQTGLALDPAARPGRARGAALLARADVVYWGGVGRGKDRHCSSRVIIGTLEQLGTFATGPEQGE